MSWFCGAAVFTICEALTCCRSIFLRQDGMVALGDFGISKALPPGKSHAKTMVGTPAYLSPEIIEVGCCGRWTAHGPVWVDRAPQKVLAGRKLSGGSQPGSCGLPRRLGACSRSALPSLQPLTASLFAATNHAGQTVQ